MKKIILVLILSVSVQWIFANIPAPQYRDEGNLDVVISGHNKIASHTFFLLTKEEDEEDQTQELLNDPQKVRLSYYRETTVFLWAIDKETGVSTDTITLNDRENDHTISITGIKDNTLQVKYKFEKNSVPPVLPITNTPGKDSDRVFLLLLSVSSFSLIILIFLLQRRYKTVHV
jgi:hypothetical protein